MTLLEQIQRAGIALPLEELAILVRRIVEAVQPEKIIVFGSAARGAMKPDSDLDLLVIKRGEFHHIELAQRIYRALGTREIAVDITVATPEEVEKYRDAYGLVLYSALREGRLIYDAEAA